VGTLWIRELSGGLDSTRLAETAHGGTMIKGEDGHINRGKEFEKRAAFVPTFTLPIARTKNLAATSNSLVVFGDQVAPVMPSGVVYQRLQHPDGSTALSRVLSYDNYSGKLYVAAEFVDGTRYHFYDGVRVAVWFDGRAHGSLSVTGASGTSLNTLLVNGVSIIAGAVNWATNNTAFAAAIAAAINAYVSTPEYTATVDGTTVNIVAGTPGIAGNDLAITYTGTALVGTPASGFLTAGGVDTTSAAAATGGLTIIGGSNAPANALSTLKINGVDILGVPVQSTGNPTTTATAVATQINNYSSAPDYKATASGAVVTVTAVDSGASLNGTSLVPTVIGDFAVGNLQALSGGVDAKAVYVPGTFVKTIRSRMHSVSGPNEHFSGIQAPTSWTTDAIGAGFIDMSQEAAGADVLTALGRYQGWVAIFAESTVLIYNIDSDPANNKIQQVLENTGTACPRSVTKYGDNDLFYLAESGVRSLQARDASNAAATTDMGTPVDTLITAKLRALAPTDRVKVIGLINPVDKRFWLIFPDQIFVFTRYDGAKVSAWTIYNPFYFVGGVQTSFPIDDAVVFKKRVYLRSGDNILCYGGVSTALATDATSAVAWLPFLDADTPTVSKKWQSFDAAVRGVWEIRVGMMPTADGVNTDDLIANISETTFNGPMVGMVGDSTHLSPRFISRGAGNAVLSSCAFHFEGEKKGET
jgi:hypothetical protein